MTLRKTSNRVIAFLMCVLVMLTVCVFQPIHEAQALVGIDDAALIALILALLAGCGVAIEVTTDEGLQGIAEDYWNSASEGAKTLIQELETKMQSYTDPHTGTYVKSKVKIGTQEYIDLHSSVNEWANQRIINGQINITSKNIPMNAPSGLSQSQWLSVISNPIFLKNEITILLKQSNGYFMLISFTPSNELKEQKKIFDGDINTIFVKGLFQIGTSQNGINYNNNDETIGSQYIPSLNQVFWSDYNLYLGTSNNHTLEIYNGALPDLEYYINTQKNNWPYKIIDRMHDLNVENPTGTGEYELTVDVEEPTKNLNPANVLPAAFAGDISTPATPPNYNEMPNTDRPSLKAKFISVFPFCLPWDLKQAFELLLAEPEAPYFSVDFLAPVREKIGITGSTTITLDMDEYPMVGEIIRWTVLISFSIGLILVTRKIIKS